MTPALNADSIAERSLAARQGMCIEVIASIPSTNTALRARTAHLQGPTLLAAEVQTAGRGRAGRSWHSAPGDSLSFSLAWPCHAPLARLSGLSLAVGVAVADTLRVMGWPVQLKWPNDLLLDGRKLGGILIETVQQPAPSGVLIWAVIGIGLNVRPNRERDSLVGHASAVLQSSFAPDDGNTATDCNGLLASLADGLNTALSVFDRDGLSPFVGRWQALHAYQDQTVRIIEQGAVLQEGVARGIDDSGQLLLETTAGRIMITAGDVSLRAADVPLSHEGAHAAAG